MSIFQDIQYADYVKFHNFLNDLSVVLREQYYVHSGNGGIPVVS